MTGFTISCLFPGANDPPAEVHRRAGRESEGEGLRGGEDARGSQGLQGEAGGAGEGKTHRLQGHAGSGG